MPYGNTYVDALALQRRGTLLADLENDLAVLLAAVQTTGKAGTLTLELKITPQKGDLGAVVISDKLTLKEPKADTPETLAYIDEKGQLTRRDPRQAALPENMTAVNPAEQATG